MTLEQEAVQDEVAALTLRIARPIIWHDRRMVWPKRSEGATCFFLQFDGGIIGVTANHVVKAFEHDHSNNPNIVCQLRNSPAFDLLGAIITRDVTHDIATFSVTADTLSEIGAIALDCRGSWPPPEPKHLELLSACGFPESMRITMADGSLVFRAWGALAVVESVTRDEILITYDPVIVRPSRWAPVLPPIGFDMSGCSGGPVLVHYHQNGLHRWFPVGMIVRGPREDKKQGDLAEFDMIRMRRIDIIQPDGGIKQAKENAGWLPGWRT